MNVVWPSFGIGVVAGLRTMTATAALTWAASLGRTRTSWIPTGLRPGALATMAAVAEMAGDKMPFAPDRRILPSLAVRLALGAAGGVSLSGPNVPVLDAAATGLAGALLGTFLGRTARGGTTRSRADWTRALTEDTLAAALAIALVHSAQRRSPA